MIANVLTPLAIFLTSHFLTHGRQKIIQEAILAETGGKKAKKRKRQRKLLSNGSDLRLVSYVKANPELLNSRQLVNSLLMMMLIPYFRGFAKSRPLEKQRRLSDLQIDYLDQLQADGLVSYEISDYLFFGSASRNAEMAGIKGAAIALC